MRLSMLFFVAISTSVSKRTANGKIAGAIRRLRRNSQLSRRENRTWKATLHDEEFDSDARELNVFLHNIASLMESSYMYEFMSMPSFLNPADTGVRDGSFPSNPVSSETSDIPPAKSSSSELILLSTSAPNPAPAVMFEPDSDADLDAAKSTCVPLGSVPGSNDIAVNISLTYELVVKANADIHAVLKTMDANTQAFLSTAVPNCGLSSRRLRKDFDFRRRLDVISALDSFGVLETPRAGT